MSNSVGDGVMKVVLFVVMMVVVIWLLVSGDSVIA